jgi:amidase
VDWLKDSILARRAVAQGRVGTHHLLSEEPQGTYHYVYGPYAKPVLTIKPGDIVEVETLDAFGGSIKSETDIPSEKFSLPFANPQNGPIAVEGGAISK